MSEPYTIADIVDELVRTQAPVPWDGASRPLRTREEVHEWLATQGVNSMDSRQMLEPIYPEGAYQNLPPQARPEMSAVSGPRSAAARKRQMLQPPPSFFGVDLPGRTMSDLSDITSQAVEERAADIGRTIGAPVVRAASEAGGRVLGALENLKGPELEEAVRVSKIRKAPSAAHMNRPMYRGKAVAVQSAPPDPRAEEQELASVKELLETEPEGPVREEMLRRYEELRPGALSRVAGRMARAGSDMAFDMVGVQPPPAARRMGEAARASLGEDIVEGTATLGINVGGLALGALGQTGQTFLEASGAADVGRGIKAHVDWLLADNPKVELKDALLEAVTSDPYEYQGLKSAWSSMEKINQERFDRDTIDNLRTDIADIVSVVPILASMVFSTPEGLSDMPLSERAGPLFESKVRAGMALSDGALAGLGYIVANPVDSLHSMPLSTLLTLFDVGMALKAAKGAAKLPPKVTSAIEKVEAKVERYLSQDPEIAQILEYGKRAHAAVDRAFGDPTANVDPVTQLMLDETLRGSRQEGAAARTQFEAIARSIERGEEGSVPFGTGSTFVRKFEEFDKSIDPSTGKIIQPTASSRDRGATPAQQQRVRKGELPIGQKGGARIRKRKVERSTFEGMVRTVKGELVEFFNPGGGERTSIRSKQIDDAVSEAVSFAVPNQVMMSKSARTQALADLKAWATDPNKANGRPKRMDDWIDPVNEKAKLETFMKNAEREINAMAARSVPEGITGSSNVYNLRLKLGDETFSVLDDSLMLLKEAGPELKRAIRSESVLALANRMSETAEQVRKQNVIVKALDDYAPTYITERRRVEKGDTIESIARDNAVTPEKIRRDGATYRGRPVDWDNLEKYVGLNIDGVAARYKSRRSGKSGQVTFRTNATPDAEFARITKALEETGSLPPALRIDPTDAALTAKIKEAGDLVGGVSASKVLRDLEGYKAIRSGGKHGILNELGVIDAAPMGSTRRVQRGPVTMPSNAIWVNPGAYSTLKWWARDRAGQRSTDSISRAMRWMKSNLTARNPTTHTNNIVANATMQGARRGQPLNVAEVMRIGSEYRDFVKGTLKDPKKAEMYRAIERSGGLKSDMVRSELEALAAGRTAEKTGKLPHEALERVYSWEDNVFKLEEAVRNYKYFDGMLDDLSTGQWVDLELTKGKRARLTNTERGWRLQMYGRNGKPGKSKGLTQSQLRDVLGQASMKPALDLFFDYRDVAQVASILRSEGRGAMAAVGAPFYTWFSKALTIPFVQRGLIGSLISGRPPVRSNSAKVLTKQLADAAAGSARRSMMINSVREELLDNHDIAASIASHHSGVLKRLPTILSPVAESVNPLYFEMRNLEYMSPSQPADTMLRVLYHGIGTLHLPSLIDGLTPFSGSSVSDAFFTPKQAGNEVLAQLLESRAPGESQRQKTLLEIWRRNPDAMNGLPASDYFELLGVSGGLIGDVPRYLGNDEDSRLYDTFASLLVPGLYVKGADVLYSAIWRYGLDKETRKDLPMHAVYRGRAFGDPYLEPKMKGHQPYVKRTDEFQRWAVRRLLGLGTQPHILRDEAAITMKDALAGRPPKDTSPLKKLYKKAASKMVESYLADPLRRVKSQVFDYRNAQGANDEAAMGAALSNVMREVQEIERVTGTAKARTVWKRYFKTGPKFISMYESPAPGLISEEIERTYKWITDPFRLDLEKRSREELGLPQTTLLEGLGSVDDEEQE